MKTKKTVQEPKCIIDHSNTLQLISRHQSDGTWYRYCDYCKWVDVKEIVSQTKQELIGEINKFLSREGYIKSIKIESNNKPTHGSCCTCQICGRHHDDCVCESNRILKFLEDLDNKK